MSHKRCAEASIDVVAPKRNYLYETARRLGSGAAWNIHKQDSCSPVTYGMYFRDIELLEQMKSGHLTDFIITTYEGTESISVHLSIMCAASSYFRLIPGIQMQEAATRSMNLPPGISLCAMKALLEFIYVGQPLEFLFLADVREVWLLAEMYDIDVALDWLSTHELTTQNSLAALAFALVPVLGSSFVEKLVATIKGFFSSNSLNFDTLKIDHVTSDVFHTAVQMFLAPGVENKTEISQWKIRDALQLTSNWLKAGGDFTAAKDIVISLPLWTLSTSQLRNLVNDTCLLKCVQLVPIYEKKLEMFREISRQYQVRRSIKLPNFQRIGQMAVHNGEKVAVIDKHWGRVLVVDLGSGEVVNEHLCMNPSSVAFSQDGMLYVSDLQDNKILVFSGDRLVKTIGSRGTEEGKFNCPTSIAITKQGELLVADTMNERVQIFDCNGTFKRCLKYEFNTHRYLRPSCVTVSENGKVLLLYVNSPIMDEHDMTNDITSRYLHDSRYTMDLVALGGDDMLFAMDSKRNAYTSPRTFKTHPEWTPIQALQESACHAMTIDSRGRLFVLTRDGSCNYFCQMLEC